MSFATGAEGMAMLLPWFRRDIEEGAAEVGLPRWFQWGYFTRRGQPRSWYILIRLPSYLMKPPYYMFDEGEPVWHQRCLLFKEKLPFGYGGWEIIEMQC